MSFDLHQSFQDLMDKKGDVLCGFAMEGEREARTHIRVDYFCKVDLNQPYHGDEEGIRPFDDVRPFTVFELEGPNRTLSKHRVRFFIGRTLIKENPHHGVHHFGEIGLIIVCVHKPIQLLKENEFQFEKITPWKYRAMVMENLPVTLILLRELQKVKGGDAAALLQILEPNKNRRKAVWQHVLDQDLSGKEQLKSTMLKLDKGVFMTVLEEMKLEMKEVAIEEAREQVREVVREQVREEVREQVREKVNERLEHIVTNFLKMQLEPATIAAATGMDLNEVLRLQANLK